jgi:prepilin-type N-terminal cleavage/methylation domain-containing protein
MKNTRKGFTLAELLLASVMVAVIIGALAFMFQVVVASWSSQGSRIGLGVSASKAVEEAARNLRGAIEIGSQNANEIRFTADKTAYYIYYLYNASDHYPNQFTKGLYQLKKTSLSGGLAGTFIYGSGNLVARDIQPPPASAISVSGNIITIDLATKRGDNVIRSAGKVRPRNI